MSKKLPFLPRPGVSAFRSFGRHPIANGFTKPEQVAKEYCFEKDVINIDRERHFSRELWKSGGEMGCKAFLYRKKTGEGGFRGQTSASPNSKNKQGVAAVKLRPISRNGVSGNRPKAIRPAHCPGHGMLAVSGKSMPRTRMKIARSKGRCDPRTLLATNSSKNVKRA